MSIDFKIKFKMCRVRVPRINTNKTKTHFRRTYILTSLVIFIFNKLDKYFFRRSDDSIIQ